MAQKINGYVTLDAAAFGRLEALMCGNDAEKLNDWARTQVPSLEKPQWVYELPGNMGAACIVYLGIAYLRRPEAR